MQRIVVGIDPPAGSRAGADGCGIVAAGLAESGVIYVLEDASVQGLAPAGWAAKAIALYRRHKADALVAEVNQGGDMVRAVLRQVDAAAPVRSVHATRGKWLRAEPVAMHYAQGKVKHVGAGFAALEDEMCDFGLEGLSSGASPDRLDALVWAVTELMGRAERPGPRIRIPVGRAAGAAVLGVGGKRGFDEQGRRSLQHLQYASQPSRASALKFLQKSCLISSFPFGLRIPRR